MKLSFHNHTEFSWDCRIPLRDLERVCLARGITAITLTDHNEIAGALKAAKMFTKVQVIVGEEINTTDGEIVGLFLTKKIARGLSLEATIGEIHKQGGVAVVVHPFDRLRSHVIDFAALERCIDAVDAIEVFNSRTVFAADNAKALAYAKKHNKPTLVGNDAHTIGEIGMSQSELPTFSDAKSFLAALHQATHTTRRSPLWVHGITKLVKWTHSYRGAK